MQCYTLVQCYRVLYNVIPLHDLRFRDDIDYTIHGRDTVTGVCAYVCMCVCACARDRARMVVRSMIGGYIVCGENGGRVRGNCA